MLSYGSEDGVACKLYHPFGFTETGDMDGNEIIAILELWDILIIDNYRLKFGEDVRLQCVKNDMLIKVEWRHF